MKDNPLLAYVRTTLLLVSITSCSVPASSGLVQLLPIEFDSRDPLREEFDRLTLISAFELRSRHPQFGGISGLAIGDDGKLYAVSDSGHWLSARMRHDAEGRLLDLVDWAIKPLLTPDGTPTARPLRDAEALARAPDGSFIVAFEQVHRLWRYLAPPVTFDSPAAPVAISSDVAQAPNNGGLECATVLANGSILTIAEEFKNPDGSFKGWLIDNGRFAEFSYTPAEDFRVSDCVALSNGDVIVLERRLSLFLSFSARLKLIKAESIRPGAMLAGEELLHLDPPLRVDNFEGIAVQEAPGGSLIYIISDDNFLPVQRTLLLQFRLPLSNH
ncbi:MAG: esterase-like activity of phytase family protein [Candidatus Binatia bacterium]